MVRHPKAQIILWNKYQVLYGNPDIGREAQAFYAVPPEIEVPNNVRNPEVWASPKMIILK